MISTLGTSTPAEATLRVEPAEAPGFAKAFSPAAVGQGGVSRLTFTIDNGVNGIEVGSLAFDDAFPAGLVVAPEPNANDSCGGTLTAAAGTSTVSLSSGSVAAGQTCTLSVDVQALRAGALANLSGALASDLPVTAPGAAATLTVNEVLLLVSMAFEPPTIMAGGVSRLTYGLDNGAAVEATSVSLSDRLPADVVLASAPDAQTSCGGTLAAAAGGDTLAFTGGALGAGASCTIAVDVTSADRRKLLERNGERDLVAGHQHRRRSHAEGRSAAGGAGLCQGFFPGPGSRRAGLPG